MSKSQEMMELVDEVSTFSWFNGQQRGSGGEESVCKHYLDKSNTAKAKLQAFADSLPRWINVMEKLPETPQLVVAKNSATLEITFRYYKGGEDIMFFGHEFTHWYPLPEPPEFKI